MPDIQTLLATKAEEEKKKEMANPWTDENFNTCELDPIPGIDERLDYPASTTESGGGGAGATDITIEGCLWKKAANDIYNKNQSGQVLMGTKDASGFKSTATVSKVGEVGQETKLFELRNMASGADMSGTSSFLFWTVKHPEFDTNGIMGGVSLGLEGNWAITKYVDLQYYTKQGQLGARPTDFNGLEGICSDGQFIYVSDSNNRRIKKLTAFDLNFVSMIGSVGTGNDQFFDNSGIDVCDGYLYIADRTNNRIQKRKSYDLSYVGKIGTAGSGDNNFSMPSGICTDGTYVYVADTGNNRIVKRLCSDLSYIGQIGTAGSGDNQFQTPIQISTDGTYLYIADCDNDRIKIHKCSDLSFVSKLGSHGGGNLQFIQPAGITFSDNFIYVGDTGNDRIMKFDKATLSFQGKYGTLGTGNDQLNNPDQMFVLGEFLYIADEGNHRVMVRFILDTLSPYFFEFDSYLEFKTAKKGIYRAVGRFTSDGYLALGKNSAADRLDLSGNARVSGQFISTLAAGTKPVDVTSTTMCTNLNADMVDGIHLGAGAFTANRVIISDNTGMLTAHATFYTDATSVGLGTSVYDGLFNVLGANYPVVKVIRSTAILNDTRSVIVLQHRTSGNMVDGFGCQFTFDIRDSAGADNIIAGLGAVRQGADNSGMISFDVYNAGVQAKAVVTIDKTGILYTGLLTVGTLAGILKGTAGVVSAITDNSVNWDAAYTHSQIAGGNSVHVSVTENTNWDTAYTHSQIAGGDSVHVSVAENTAWDTAYGWGNHAIVGYLTSVTPHNILSTTHGDTTVSSPNDQDVLTWNNATSKWIAAAPPAAAPHALLSTTHNDTTAAAVVRGDVMIGLGATPKWERLADVAAGSYFRSGGVGLEPLWSTLILPNAATAFRLPVASGANTIGELAAVGATGEYLAGVTGAIPAWATLNQAAIDGLKTTQGPTFDYTDLGGKAIKTTCKAKVYLSAIQNINHDAWTKILLDTESYDTGSNFASNKFTAPVAGYYLVCANIYWQGIDAGKLAYVGIYIDGVNTYNREDGAKAIGTAQPQFIDIIYLAAAKYVEVYGYYYSTGNTAFASSGSANTSLTVHLLSIA